MLEKLLIVAGANLVLSAGHASCPMRRRPATRVSRHTHTPHGTDGTHGVGAGLPAPLIGTDGVPSSLCSRGSAPSPLYLSPWFLFRPFRPFRLNTLVRTERTRDAGT